MPEPFTILVPNGAGNSSSRAECLPIREPSRPCEAIRVDLGDLGFAAPMFMIRLRAFVEYHCAAGRLVEVLPPVDTNVANYLSRMAVADDLPEGATFDLPQTQRRDLGDVLIPVRRYRHPSEIDRLDDEIYELIQSRFQHSLGPTADAFTMALSEMCDNAATHGRSDHGLFVAAQSYSGRRCEIAIGDCGIGIPNHMRRHYGDDGRDDGEVIAHATEERVSGTGSSHRGFGYHHTIEKLLAPAVTDGRVRVWAGTGRFNFRSHAGRETVRKHSVWDHATEGTWVYVSAEA